MILNSSEDVFTKAIVNAIDQILEPGEDKDLDESLNENDRIATAVDDDDTVPVMVVECNDGVRIYMPAVGADTKDVDITYSSGKLTISVKVHQPKVDGRVIVQQIRDDVWRRSFHVKCDDTDRIQAKLQRGLLEVFVPKPASKKIPVTWS